MLVWYMRQKIYREKRKLTDGMNEKELTDMYRTFHINAKVYLLLSTSEPSPKMTILHSKANICRYEKIGVILCVLLEHQPRFKVRT